MKKQRYQKPADILFKQKGFRSDDSLSFYEELEN